MHLGRGSLKPKEDFWCILCEHKTWYKLQNPPKGEAGGFPMSKTLFLLWHTAHCQTKYLQVLGVRVNGGWLVVKMVTPLTLIGFALTGLKLTMFSPCVPCECFVACPCYECTKDIWPSHLRKFSSLLFWRANVIEKSDCLIETGKVCWQQSNMTFGDLWVDAMGTNEVSRMVCAIERLCHASLSQRVHHIGWTSLSRTLEGYNKWP